MQCSRHGGEHNSHPSIGKQSSEDTKLVYM